LEGGAVGAGCFGCDGSVDGADFFGCDDGADDDDDDDGCVDGTLLSLGLGSVFFAAAGALEEEDEEESGLLAKVVGGVFPSDFALGLDSALL